MLAHPRVNVVLQHQNRLVRELLATHLTREPGITLAGTVASAPELVQLCHLCRPEVAVFEADTPRWSNERLVTLLLEPGRRLRMVGVHEVLPAAYVIRAYEAGISALVSYARGLDALVAAIKVPSVAVEITRLDKGTRQVLTTRELEVLYLISAGYAPRQVAYELGISLHTVEHHKQRIFAKLDVHNQAHAAASATRLGLMASVIDLPRQERGQLRDLLRVCVITRTTGCLLADRVRRILDEHGIPVVGADEPGVATVLIDPEPEDWQAVVVNHSVPVVVASRELPLQHALEALSSGVTVLPAARMDGLIVPAVHAAGQGHLMVDAAHSRTMLGRARGGDRTWWRWQLSLTRREQEIIASIGRGHSAKQTARLLGISVRTVENLQSSLFRKLGVHSKAAALAAAQDLGLLEDGVDGTLAQLE
ncbi:helix-turn-helix domain-containing protein [Kutzneria kofuensis]|uniref:DNA-binding NarL/FixJ family response regulator n=1 Tax=Kutzneria kofuensis TaxID=103725 RepID=A0A7W9KDC1_9PSEU|nr:LuxR C-terminal-related transcriptional regulator [Kutzneria kofuensis]MBB5890522.1 DNA-binding NarL/FixJ family response regulator [Kutzneria kofuensis]